MHGSFFYAKFHPYSLTVYAHWEVLQFFLMFGKHFDVIHVHQVVNLFLGFMKFVAPVHFLSMGLSDITITNSNGDIASP